MDSEEPKTSRLTSITSKEKSNKLTSPDSYVVLNQRYRDLFGDLVCTYTEEPLRKQNTVSIRVNTLKTPVEPILKEFATFGWDPTPLDWTEDGFLLHAPKLKISQTQAHSLGLIYIQDIGSMIPPLLLNTTKNTIVLDMCASPGSKTTQLAALMNNRGIIIANDNRRNRLKALGGNLQRCGIS
ncbi:MAG: hypothetical protein ACW976_06320, partial [Candidatus Ranarchaeia archaeon]